MPNSPAAWFRQLSLGQKFLVSFGLLLLLLCLGFSAVLFFLSRLNSYVDRHQRITVPAVVTAAAIRHDALEASLLLHSLFEHRFTGTTDDALHQLSLLHSRMREGLDLYRTTHAARTHPILFHMLKQHGQTVLVDQEDSTLHQIASVSGELADRQRALVGLLQTAHTGEVLAQFAAVESLTRQLANALTALLDVHAQIDREMKIEGDRLLQQAELVILALALLLATLIMTTYAIVSRHIASPLRRLAKTADQVAHHDLTANFDPWPTQDEVGTLARSLDAMLENLRERTKALERKTRELEAFTYSVAHDLKGPLREIEGFSALVQQKYASTLDQTANRYLALIRSSALRLARLIDALLRYSRIEQQRLAPSAVNLRALIEEIVADRLAATSGRPPSISVNLPFDEVWGEPTSLRQALVNLLDNAVKFSRHSEQPEIRIGGMLSNGERIIWVQDNGIGFDPKEAPKLFGLFHRLHDSSEYEGTGVGLAIVKLVIEKHGGRVWAESSPGKGSTFYLALPDKPKTASRCS